MVRISEDELLAELSRLSSRKDDGMTVQEWAEKMGRSVHYTQRALIRAKALGWLIRGKQTREALDGRPYQANVYRIVKPKKRG